MRRLHVTRKEIRRKGNSLLNTVKELLEWQGPRFPPLKMA